MPPSEGGEVDQGVRVNRYAGEGMIPTPPSGLRILVTTGIFPPDIGGPATYVPVLAGELWNRGCRVRVITLSQADGRREDGYPFPVTRLPRGTPLALRIPRLVRCILEAGAQADLFLSAGLPIETAVAAAYLRRPLVMKVVGDRAWERGRIAGTLVDDLDVFQRRRYGWRVEAHRALERWAIRRATRVITPSRFLQGVVVGWGIPSRVVAVIPNAVPDLHGLATEAGGLREPSDPNGRLTRIITVARLVPWKGVDRIIEGIALLKKAGLTVVGDGPDRGRLEALARQRSARVRFTGAVPRAAALSLVRAADVLVLNSSYEGLPHVVLEAMALGTPVIAAASPGTRELIRHGETGLLVAQGTAEEIAGAIERVQGDESLRKQIVAAASALARQFTAAAMVDRTWALLQECLSERP